MGVGGGGGGGFSYEDMREKVLIYSTDRHKEVATWEAEQSADCQRV